MMKSIPQAIDICFDGDRGRECYSVTAYEQIPGQYVADCDCERVEQCGEICDGWRSVSTDEITQAHAMGLESVLRTIEYEADNGLRKEFEWEAYD